MKKMNKRLHKSLSGGFSYIAAASLVLAMSIVPVYNVPEVSAAACVPPSTDYGTVTQNISVTDAGDYRIWTRMAAPNSSDNTYQLDVDSTDCYTVGGSGVPVYGSPSGPYFVAGASNWTAKTSAGSFIDVNLTAGSHTLKLIGMSAGVVLDRILLTRDTACVPTSEGDDCATEYYRADINTDSSVDFLDFSALASNYGQSGGGVGRSDINRDGTVDFLDFSLLSANYGN